jgi:glycosyltransferase involved in cell wall biosynthesis
MSDLAELPPIASEPLTVLVAAHNNAAGLAEVLGGWAAQLAGLRRDYEILLVDDGSTDGTEGLARFLAGRLPRVRVLSHASPRGFGAALRTGLAAARFPLFFYTTCDQQYRPDDLKCLLDNIDKVHLISGYRVSAPVPFGLRWVGWVYRGLVRVVWGESLAPLAGWLGWSGHTRRWLARYLLGVRVEDVDCAFRLFRRSVFERIPIQSDGPFAQVEILAKANFLGCLMCEEPVPHRPNPGGWPDNHRRTFGERLREAYRVFARPDFGPPPVANKDIPSFSGEPEVTAGGHAVASGSPLNQEGAKK